MPSQPKFNDVYTTAAVCQCAKCQYNLNVVNCVCSFLVNALLLIANSDYLALMLVHTCPWWSIK